MSMTHKLIFEKNVISEDNFGFRISARQRLYYKNYKNQFYNGNYYQYETERMSESIFFYLAVIAGD